MMAEPNYVQWVQPLCDAGTTAANFTLTATGIKNAKLHRVEIRIPAGHQGFTGIALNDSGSWIVPYANPGPAWLIGDDDLLEYPYEREIGENVQLATYNTGTYNHEWEVRLIYTPVAAITEDTNVIVTPLLSRTEIDALMQ